MVVVEVVKGMAVRDILIDLEKRTFSQCFSNSRSSVNHGFYCVAHGYFDTVISEVHEKSDWTVFFRGYSVESLRWLWKIESSELPHRLPKDVLLSLSLIIREKS
jgi:hypothetical protein